MDQLNLMTDPDAEDLTLFNIRDKDGTGKTVYTNTILQMYRDYNYPDLHKQIDLIRKYISDNNIDYGTTDENGFIVKKDQER